jgi:hypothetical protein
MLPVMAAEQLHVVGKAHQFPFNACLCEARGWKRLKPTRPISSLVRLHVHAINRVMNEAAERGGD